MSNSSNQLITQIALEHLNIPTLDIQRSDHLDFHEVSVWDVESALLAAYQGGISSVRSNLHEFLAEQHEIACIWSTEDVKEIRPDLTEEQAWEVLQSADRHHDAAVGIGWENIDIEAEQLFGPEPEGTSHDE